MTHQRPDAKVDSRADLIAEAAEMSTAYITSSDATVAPELPARFGRYEVRGVRGTGGFATVYAGYDSQLHREVAIKVPSARLLGKDTQELFLREARNLARLRHPGILTVFDVGVEDGLCFIVSDLLDGSPLQDWLAGSTKRAFARCDSSRAKPRVITCLITAPSVFRSHSVIPCSSLIKVSRRVALHHWHA
jgi:serine/threonine protein kinase